MFISIIIFALIINIIESNICKDLSDEPCFDIRSQLNGTSFKIQQSKSIIFECYIKNKASDVSIAWLHNNQLLSLDSKILKPDSNLFIDSDSQTKFNLHIKYLEIYHRGTYTCQIVTSGSKNLEYTLDVLVAPTITRLPNSNLIDVKQGDNITIQCITQGNPQPKITWTKKGNSHNSNVKINDDKGTMSISNINKLNADLYSCTAMNGVGDPVTSEFQLLIKYAPQVKFLDTESTNSSVLYTSIGKREQLICIIKAYPIPKIKLYHKNQEIQESNFKIDENKESQQYTLSYTLSVSTHNLGDYKCTAENEIDRTKDLVTLTNKISQLRLNLTHSQVYSDAFIFEWSCFSGSSIDEIETQFLNNLQINSSEITKTKRLIESKPNESLVLIRNFHEINKLNLNTSYTVRIRVKNLDGEWSVWSQNITFKTLNDSNQKINYHKSLIHQSHHRHQHEKKYKFEGYNSLSSSDEHNQESNAISVNIKLQQISLIFLSFLFLVFLF